MRRLTMSRTPIASHCVWFLRDGAVWRDSGSTYAKVGRATHACKQVITEGELPDLEKIAGDEALDDDEAARLRDFVQKWATWAATKERTGWLCEAKFAYCVADDTARALKSVDARDYSEAKPGEITGTADVVFLAAPGRMYAGSPRMVVVLDYKTGFGRSVVSIKRNLQLRGLALLAARAWGVDHAMVKIVHVPEDRPVWEETDELDYFKLGAVAAQLGEIVARAEAGEAAKPGPWCRYCPAKADCEATRAAIADVVPPIELTKFKLSFAITNERHAKWTLAMIDLIETAARELRISVKRFVDANGPLHLDDGTIFQGWPGTRREIDLAVPGARALIESEGVGELVEQSVALGKISRRLGKRRADGLFERLKTIGALHVNETSPRYEARNAKGEEAA